jgi:hypothetical protein
MKLRDAARRTHALSAHFLNICSVCGYLHGTPDETQRALSRYDSDTAL